VIDPPTGSRTVAAHVTSITHQDSGVRRIKLALARSLPETFRHRPGQYLNVVHPGGGAIPLSIASAPERLPELELHYRPTRGVVQADLMNDLLASASATTEWTLDGPHGNVIVDGATTDALWLIAGGTGIAQCCCIVDHLRSVPQNEPVHLLWSVSDPAHLYCDSQLRARASWLSYEPLVDAPGSTTNAAVAWLRRNDVVVHGRVILSGGPAFVHAVHDVLRETTRAGTSFESDVFSYAPCS
jgi:CDP-4-dehydro-6-deoxyglucose reductase